VVTYKSINILTVILRYVTVHEIYTAYVLYIQCFATITNFETFSLPKKSALHALEVTPHFPD
jgi:hypothetical protein